MLSQHQVLKTANGSGFVEVLLWLLAQQVFPVVFLGEQMSVTGTFPAARPGGLFRQRSCSLQAEVNAASLLSLRKQVQRGKIDRGEHEVLGGKRETAGEVHLALGSLSEKL